MPHLKNLHNSYQEIVFGLRPVVDQPSKRVRVKAEYHLGVGVLGLDQKLHALDGSGQGLGDGAGDTPLRP